MMFGSSGFGAIGLGPAVGAALIKGGGGAAILRSIDKLFGEQTTGSFTNRTFHLTKKRVLPWTRVRGHIFSSDAASGLKLSVGVSANITTIYQPSGGSAGMQLLTFPSNALAASVIGSGIQRVPNILSSDWLDLPSVARSDGSGYLFMARLYQDAASSGIRSSHANTAPTDVDTYGYWAGLRSVAGDFCQVDGVFAANTSGPPVFFEFEHTSAVKTIAVVGDSTIQGRDVNNLRITPGSRLAVEQLQSEGHSVEFANFGWNGASTAGGTGTPPAAISGYWGKFLAYMAAVSRKPDIVVFQPCSVNNSNFTAAAGVTETTYWCGVFADWCAANGVTGLLATPLPVGTPTTPAYSEAQETIRRSHVSTIKSTAATRGLGVVDRDLLTDQGNVLGGFQQDAWAIADGIHLATAGGLQEQPIWYAAIGALV